MGNWNIKNLASEVTFDDLTTPNGKLKRLENFVGEIDNKCLLPLMGNWNRNILLLDVSNESYYP